LGLTQIRMCPNGSFYQSSPMNLDQPQIIAD
jgi:hypothetical protein